MKCSIFNLPQEIRNSPFYFLSGDLLRKRRFILKQRTCDRGPNIFCFSCSPTLAQRQFPLIVFHWTASWDDGALNLQQTRCARYRNRVELASAPILERKHIISESRGRIMRLSCGIILAPLIRGSGSIINSSDGVDLSMSLLMLGKFIDSWILCYQFLSPITLTF